MTNQPTSFPKATIAGSTRVGPPRDLKKALEAFGAGKNEQETFGSASHSLR